MIHRYGRAFGPILVLTTLAVGVSAFVAGFGNGEPAGLAAARAMLSPPPSVRPVVRVAPADGNALRALMTPPPGARGGPAMVLDAAGLSADPAVTAALRARGFEIAAVGSWTVGAQDRDRLSTELFQFRDPIGATGYVLEQESELGTHRAHPIPDGTAFDFVIDQQNRAVLIGPIGPFVVQMTFTSTGRLDPTAEQAAYVAQTVALVG